MIVPDPGSWTQEKAGRTRQFDTLIMVPIDWIALTAGILLLGIMVVYPIFNNGVSVVVSNVNSTLSGIALDVSAGTIENLNP